MSGESDRFDEWPQKRVARVVINISADGDIAVMTDEPCAVYVVNDHVPHDRVYRLTEAHTVSAAAVDAELKDDAIGHSGDARHAAAENRILSIVDGKPHLKPVK